MNQIKDGQFTLTIYGYLRMKKYSEVIDMLFHQRFMNPTSRAALSLLAYCYFQTHDFVRASDCYEQLTHLCPNNSTYRLQFAHCLHRAGLNDAAMKIVNSMASTDTGSNLGDEDPQRNQIRVLKLKAAICFDNGDISGASTLVRQCSDEDPDIIINTGCLLYQENKYKEACARFLQALSVNPKFYTTCNFVQVIKKLDFISADCRISTSPGLLYSSVLLSNEAILSGTETYCRHY